MILEIDKKELEKMIELLNETGDEVAVVQLTNLRRGE